MPNRTRVLLVSRHPAGHSLVSPALDQLRYEVTTAQLGNAISTLQAHPADLIVAEIPTLTEAVACIRDLQEIRRVPCVAVVHSPTPDDYDVAGQVPNLLPHTSVLFPPLDALSVRIRISQARLASERILNAD